MTDHDKTHLLWKCIDTPTHFITVNPMTPMMTIDDLHNVLDATNYRFLRMSFGRGWKSNLRRYHKMVIVPECRSPKNTGNRPTLLHGHGILQIESKELLRNFFKYFNILFIEEVSKQRMRRRISWKLAKPQIHVSRFKPNKDAKGYSMKNRCESAAFSDIYPFGKETKTSRGIPKGTEVV